MKTNGKLLPWRKELVVQGKGASLEEMASERGLEQREVVDGGGQRDIPSSRPVPLEVLPEKSEQHLPPGAALSSNRCTSSLAVRGRENKHLRLPHTIVSN